MHVSEVKGLSRPLVTAVAADCLHIDGRRHDHHVLIHADRVQRGEPDAGFDALTVEHLDTLLADAPEIFLIGCGPRQQLAGREMRQRLHAAGIGFEVMVTPAACRTYNLIVAEGRRVSALLFL